MSERQPHSLKNDIIVGMGGLAVAALASFSEIKDIVSTRMDQDKGSSGEQNNICIVDTEKQVATCSSAVSDECIDDLMYEVVSPANIGWFEIPRNCQVANTEIFLVKD